MANLQEMFVSSFFYVYLSIGRQPLDRDMLRKEKSLLHFLIHSLAGGLFAFVLIFQQYWSLSRSQRKETIFLLEKIKVDDGIFSGLNVKRRFSDYRF